MSTTPIIAGFHPDPSVCRVGDTYYLVTSSFEYRPGVPLFTSDDLVGWRQLGSILQRPEQLRPTKGSPSRGIFASTIRHHDGRFWMVTTHFEDIMKGQLLVWSEAPDGPWSDAVFIEGAIGIDPDLAWDEDGVCHLTWAAHGIMSVPVDPETGTMLAEPRSLWSGTGMASPEGPHLYQKDGYWYLLIAEGGTERGHSVSIARARSLDGPWEGAPSNPILSHRSTDHPVQNTGHADLIERPDGSWAMVHLGARPRGFSPMFHTNGRETFLTGVDWVDGWPVIDENRFDVPVVDHSFEERFTDAPLDARWIAVGDFPQTFSRFTDPGLVLTADSDREASPTLATRVRDLAWTAEIDLDPGDGVARFSVRMKDDHWYGIEVSPTAVEGKATVGPFSTVTGTSPRTQAGTVRLRIAARKPPQTGALLPTAPDLVSLTLVPTDGSAEVSFGEFDGRYLSTEVTGGFTGRVLAVEPLEGETLLSRFSYRTDPHD